MEKVLTIVIPAYNVELYLRNCLDSFIVEEAMEELEIIVIDDGSTDETLKIAKEYEEKNRGIFKVVHKENGGHGSTINLGIVLAKGKYFKVVDGDDWVNKKGFEKLLEFLKKTDSDVVISHYTWISHDTKKVIKQHNTLLQGLQYGIVYNFSAIAEKLYLRMHELAIKTEILQKNEIRMDEHCFYVDQEYVNYPVLYWNTITFADAEVYQYRIGLNGQSMSRTSMQKNVEQHEYVLWQLLNYYKKAKEENREEWKCKFLAKSISYMLASQIKIYLSFDECEEMKRKIIELDKNIKKDFPEVYNNVKNKAVWLLRKTDYVLYPLGVRILQAIWR